MNYFAENHLEDFWKRVHDWDSVHYRTVEVDQRGAQPNPLF